MIFIGFAVLGVQELPCFTSKREVSDAALNKLVRHLPITPPSPLPSTQATQVNETKQVWLRVIWTPRVVTCENWGWVGLWPWGRLGPDIHRIFHLLWSWTAYQTEIGLVEHTGDAQPWLCRCGHQTEPAESAFWYGPQQELSSDAPHLHECTATSYPSALTAYLRHAGDVPRWDVPAGTRPSPR